MAILKMTKAEASEAMVTAMQNQDVDGYKKAVEAYGEAVASEFKEEIECLKASNDQAAMAARGKKPLTSAEMKFAKDFKALAQRRANGEDIKAELTKIKMPEETIDFIFDDITTGHPLLGYVDFQNTAHATKWLMAKNTYQKALWGAFDATVTQELASEFSEIDMTKMSLTAFVPVSRGVLDMGPDWIYRYVVAILREAIANGLEDGIINNLKSDTGPIGMLADLSKGNTSDTVTTYTAKTKTKITKLDPTTYGKLLSELSKTPNGNFRTVNKVVMIVNPADYFTKVFPAVTVMGTNGQYTTTSLPFPTVFVQSLACPAGTAIMYLDKRYWVGVGQSGQAGTIEQSDEYKFLERKRYYMIYMYADGMPKDNYACLPLDISKLEPASIAVTVNGTVTTSGGAAA